MEGAPTASEGPDARAPGKGGPTDARAAVRGIQQEGGLPDALLVEAAGPHDRLPGASAGHVPAAVITNHRQYCTVGTAVTTHHHATAAVAHHSARCSLSCHPVRSSCPVIAIPSSPSRRHHPVITLPSSPSRRHPIMSSPSRRHHPVVIPPCHHHSVINIPAHHHHRPTIPSSPARHHSVITIPSSPLEPTCWVLNPESLRPDATFILELIVTEQTSAQ